MIEDIYDVHYRDVIVESELKEIVVGEFRNGQGYITSIPERLVELGWERHPNVEVILRLKKDDREIDWDEVPM